MAKSFPASQLKLLPQGFSEAAESMKEKEIEDKIISFEMACSSLVYDKKNDPNLERLKNEYKDASSVYSQPLKESKAAISYLIYVLENRGKV